MIIYRIYTKRNLADTSRDPDDIITEELGYKSNLDDAIKMGNDYIKEHFFRKDTELHLNKDGNYSATNFCSYGETLYIDKWVSVD